MVVLSDLSPVRSLIKLNRRTNRRLSTTSLRKQPRVGLSCPTSKCGLPISFFLCGYAVQKNVVICTVKTLQQNNVIEFLNVISVCT